MHKPAQKTLLKPLLKPQQQPNHNSTIMIDLATTTTTTKLYQTIESA
jgi:hypothetical protein